MVERSFKQFLALKEGNTPRKASADRKLEKGREFLVDRHNNPQLIPLIKAFKDSKSVRIGDFIPGGFTTAKTDGGAEEPKLKNKGLYLTGGAVRDHLANKRPRDLDLVTDATPSEIRMILIANGFTEDAPKAKGKGKRAELKTPPGVSEDPHKRFYVSKYDKKGNELAFGIKVKGSKAMKLSTMRKEHKGDEEDIPELTVSDLDGDANGRDFTINSMYIQLDNPDGANAKLIDPHNGLIHLGNGSNGAKVSFVGKAADRLGESPLRAFRYIRFHTKYGKGSVNSIPDKYMQEIRNLAKKGFGSVSKEAVREEFLKGLKDRDVDPKKYIRVYRDLGALNKIFPHMNFKLDNSEDFSDERDHLLAVAWILRKNDPKDISEMLEDGGWTAEEIKKITYLIRYLKFNPDVDPEDLIRLHTDNPWPGEYANDGGRLEKWARMNGKPLKHVKGFHQYLKSPVLKIYDDKGEVGPEFQDLIDPITQLLDIPGASSRRNQMELGRLGKIMKTLQKLNDN